MKAFFEGIFEYHHHFNQEITRLLGEHQKQIGPRSLDLFSHMLNAHQIWNARILDQSPLGVNDCHTLEKCQSMDITNLQETRTILNQFDLSTHIAYANSKGQSFSNTIQDILFHVNNHHTHHRGQIVAELRRHDIQPPVTDYIFYRR